MLNVAYSGQNDAVVETSEEMWDQAYRVSVKAVAVACRAAIPQMIKTGGGSIINTSSVQGLLASRRNAPYNAF